MYVLCTKDNIDVVCNKILSSEISELNIKEIDNAYMMKFELNTTDKKYDKKVLANLYNTIREFYNYLIFGKVEVFELNYNLNTENYSLFKSYDDANEEDIRYNHAAIEKAKSYLRNSLELFEMIGIDKLSLETIYTKEKNRYKNISFLEALRELNKYI